MVRKPVELLKGPDKMHHAMKKKRTALIHQQQREELRHHGVIVMNTPLPVPEPLMLLLVAYLAWSLELD